MSHDSIAARYLGFAEHQAAGSCDVYADFARAVAASKPVLGFLASVPEANRQPNLLLAAVRWVGGLADDGEDFCHRVVEHADGVRATMLSRTTQTNEPGRCATLLPLLCRLPQPLAQCTAKPL